MKWNGRKWSQPVYSTAATFASRDREKPMKICQASWCHGQDSHQVLPSEPIPSVDLYNIIHHRQQNKNRTYPSLPQYVHTVAVTTIHCRYIHCTPASATTCTAPFISTALYLAKYTSLDVNAQSKVR